MIFYFGVAPVMINDLNHEELQVIPDYISDVFCFACCQVLTLRSTIESFLDACGPHILTYTYIVLCGFVHAYVCICVFLCVCFLDSYVRTENGVSGTASMPW